MAKANGKIWQKIFSARATLLGALAIALLPACQELKSETGTTPTRVVSTGRSTVTSSGGEVGVSHTVTVHLVDKKGYGIYRVTPRITAVNGGGAEVAGITAGSCTNSDGFGYSTCSISSTVAGSYTLKVTSPVTFTGGTITFTQVARSLTFTAHPGNALSTANIATTPVTLEVRDRVGTLISTATDVITMSLTSAGSATLAGTLSATAVAGVATFNSMNVDISGSYTLTATSAGGATGVSNSFTISAGAATQLAFTTQPSTLTAANIVFSQQPVVQVRDAQGNVVTSSSCTITLALLTGTGTLAGSSSVASSSGVATFSGLRIITTAGGTNYTLRASGCALTTATSDAFEITLSGVPTQLSVATPPGNAALSQTWPTQPVVQVLDSYGALVSTDNSTIVTIAKDGAAPNGPLSGATSIRVTNGVATFTNLRIASTNSAHAGSYDYDFTATSSGTTLTAATSTGQLISQDGLTAPFSFSFEVQPTDASPGQTISPAVKVQRVDANGNLNFSDNSTVVDLGIVIPGTTSVGTGTLSNSSATVVGGVATFSSLSINGTGVSGPKELRASTAGPATTAVNSSTFSIADFSSASRLVFANTPVAGGTGQSPWTTQPIVQVQDSAGNVVANDNSTQVTLGIAAYSTGSSATLLGTLTKTAVNGVADFAGLNLRTQETGLTNLVLRANASGLTEGQSLSFNGNVGVAYALDLPVAIADSTATNPAPFSSQPIIHIVDSGGNLVTADNTTVVTVAMISSTGGTAPVLQGTLTATAAGGVVTFTDLRTDDAAVTNITLRFTAPGLIAETSNAFDGNP